MQETKRRGRPARGEQTDPQSSLCTIKDPAMDPYYIVKDATNFTVMEVSISTRGFGGKEASGRDQSGSYFEPKEDELQEAKKRDLSYNKLNEQKHKKLFKALIQG